MNSSESQIIVKGDRKYVRAVKKKGMLYSLGKYWVLYVMAFPVIFLTLLFKYIPLFGIIISFKDFRYDRGIWGSAWNGLNNFRFFIITDTVWKLTLRTVLYNIVFLILGVLIPVIIALMLNELRSSKVLKIYQTSMLFPYFPSWIIVSYVVYAFINMRYGILSTFINSIGWGEMDWYGTPWVWIVILPVIYIWKSAGYTSIIFYATLICISEEYYEAADIDGASRWQKVRYISIPFLKRVIIIMFVLGLGHIISGDFGLFYQVPQLEINKFLFETCDILNTYVYRVLKVDGNIATSSVVSFYQSLVGFIMIVGSNMIIRRVDSEKSLY